MIETVEDFLKMRHLLMPMSSKDGINFRPLETGFSISIEKGGRFFLYCDRKHGAWAAPITRIEGKWVVIHPWEWQVLGYVRFDVDPELLEVEIAHIKSRIAILEFVRDQAAICANER